MKFRHFRGGLYTLITGAKHSETEEHLVIYGGCGDGAEGIWARPATMFHENIKCEHCNHEWPRFTPVDSPPAEPCNCAAIIALAKKYEAFSPKQVLDYIRYVTTHSLTINDHDEFIRKMREDVYKFGGMFRANIVAGIGGKPEWNPGPSGDWGGRVRPDHVDPPRCLHNNCGVCGGTC